MIKRIAIVLGGVLFWVTLAITGSHVFGADQFLLIAIVAILCALTVGKIVRSFRKRRFDKAVGAIDKTDAQSVRFNGTPAQAPLALEVAKASGWAGEILPDTTQNMLSIRFTPIDGASTVTEFLEALFEAKLVSKVQP